MADRRKLGKSVQSIKDFWQKLQAGTKKLLVIIVSVTLILVLAAIFALRMAENANYSTLFTGLNQEEAQEVVGLLQEDGINYQYSDNNGTIRVPTAQVDQTRAQLLSEGYPKSGFAYDMYINNAGLMTTESDKQQYTLYDLQDRLGATIRLFEGVQDAKVTIAVAEERTYALGDDSQKDATASVVVTMKNGRSLSSAQASAIKNLVSHAVRGMNFTNVAVFDAETMLEVGGTETESSYGNGESLAALTTLIENNIAANIRRVLEKLYGQGNVAISVKGTINMERLIQENTQYSVPAQVEEEDRSGLLYWESVADENSGAGGAGAGGVAGADANADVPRYTVDNGTGNQVDTYANSSATREWLFNTLKEQRQIDPGVLENTTVGVVIDTDNMEVPLADLISLVANSAGIPQETAREKITIIRALGPGSAAGTDVEASGQPAGEEGGFSIPLPILIALIAGVLLLLLILVLLLRRRAKRRRQEEEELELATEPFDLEAAGEDQEQDQDQGLTAAARLMEEEDSEMAQNEEILNLRMQRNLKLKQNIGEFVDQNPQVAAKLLQGWLRGEENNGGKRSSGTGTK